MELKEILERAKLNRKDLIAVYPYGSRVYSTYDKHSDYDFIIITKKKSFSQFSDNLINITFYTPEEHQQRLNDHEISALECYFLKSDFYKRQTILLDDQYPFKFNLDLSKLRHSLVEKSSNSWVKAKKKLTVQKDYDLNLGRKSLFHAIRIIDYGIQIALVGRIMSYENCNEIYRQIMEIYNWPTLFATFKKKYNESLSEFRKLAPKKLKDEKANVNGG